MGERCKYPFKGTSDQQDAYALDSITIGSAIFEIVGEI
jgi:hypothetical protein